MGGDINNYEPTQINFRIFKEYRYLFEDTVHSNKSFFDSIIQNHECFIERQNKYNNQYNKYKRGGVQQNFKKNYNSSTQKKKERTKIGNRDISKESIIKKDFQAILNKITENNIEKMIKQINNIIDTKYINVILDLIYQYLLLQPTFQYLYINLLDNIYNNYVEIQYIIKEFWLEKFEKYLYNNEWSIDEKTIEETENYDDFCESIKMKKQKVSLIKCWARLINYQFLDYEPTELFQIILSNCFILDMNNSINCNIIDNYIDQLSEFYDTVSDEYKYIINNMYNEKINDFININLKKKTYFKVLDFLEVINKK
jgi:hypothetical protein